jgi:hypothetical protein
VEMPCAGLCARERHVAEPYPGQDRRRGQATALPRRSACGHERKERGARRSRDGPTCQREPRGRGGSVKKRCFPRGFLEIAVTRLFSKG